MRGYGLLAAGALAFVAPPAWAANNLACMDGVLIGDHKSMFDDYFKTFRVDKLLAEGPSRSLFAIVTERAGLCADEHGWSPAAIEQAVLYMTMGRMWNEGLETQTIFTAAQWQRVRQVYATMDKAILRRLLEPALDAAFAGEKGPSEQATEADAMYFGRMMLKTGLPMTEENAKFLGNWMASMLMMDIFSERFAKY